MNTLFDSLVDDNPCSREGDRRRDRALGLLRAHPPPPLRQLQRAFLQHLLDHGEDTSDALRRLVEIPSGIDPRIVGSAVRSLAELRLIVSVGRRKSHRGPAPQPHDRVVGDPRQGEGPYLAPRSPGPRPADRPRRPGPHHSAQPVRQRLRRRLVLIAFRPRECPPPALAPTVIEDVPMIRNPNPSTRDELANGTPADFPFGAGTPPGPTSAPDPFDVGRLRLPADDDAALGVQELLVTIPYRKPSKEQFIRV